MKSKFEIDKKNIPFYILIIFIFLILKLIFSFLNTNEIIFLLKPTNKLVEIFTGQNSFFIPNEGYFYENLNIIINKSCSGFNFLLLCFVMLSFSALKFLVSTYKKLIFILLIFIFSFIFTIFVNASRINFSIVLSNKSSFDFNNISWLHQAEGIFVYLFFLVAIYLFFEFIMKKISIRYEKLT